MRIVSTELQQVFRAYTKQLRGEYDKARPSVGRESVARGFERVDISPEAKAALAQSLTEAADASDEVLEADDSEDRKEESSDTSEDESQEANSSKDQGRPAEVFR